MIQKENQKYERGTFIFLILCFCYGFYRHGLYFYFQGQMSLKDVFMPLLPVLIGIVESFYFTKIKKEKLSWNTLSIGVLLGILVPPSFPLLYFVLASFAYFILVFLLQKTFSRVHFLNLYKCLILLLTLILPVSYQNIVEQNGTFVYGTLDILFGKGLGGYGTTNIVLLLLFYFFLTSFFYYKKELPIYAFATYAVCFFLHYFLVPSAFLLSQILNSSVFFSFILFLPTNATSPVSKKGKIFYGMMIGLFSYILIHICKIVEGAYLSLAIINILYSVWYLIYKARQNSTKLFNIINMRW